MAASDLGSLKAEWIPLSPGIQPYSSRVFDTLGVNPDCTCKRKLESLELTDGSQMYGRLNVWTVSLNTRWGSNILAV